MCCQCIKRRKLTMRQKDFDNTYNKKPENFTEELEYATGTYTNADQDGWTELKNKDFVQMYKTYKAELIELAITAPTASGILILMSSGMDLNNTYIVEQKDIASALHKSVDMVKKSIKVLKDRDFITTYKVNKQNVYFINPRIFCKVSGSYKQKLIDEYVKINQEKVYTASPENVDLSKINKPKIQVKFEFQAEHKELARPSNQEVHKMNEIKDVLNRLDKADEAYLQNKYISTHRPTYNEIEAIKQSAREQEMDRQNKLFEDMEDIHLRTRVNRYINEKQDFIRQQEGYEDTAIEDKIRACSLKNDMEQLEDLEEFNGLREVQEQIESNPQEWQSFCEEYDAYNEYIQRQQK